MSTAAEHAESCCAARARLLVRVQDLEARIAEQEREIRRLLAAAPAPPTPVPSAV